MKLSKALESLFKSKTKITTLNQTTQYVPLHNSDGSFQGLAQLADMHGESWRMRTYCHDLDALTEPGIYGVSSGATGIPNSGNGTVIYLERGANSLQIFLRFSGETYMRYWNNGWTGWKSLLPGQQAFLANYASLSELTEAAFALHRETYDGVFVLYHGKSEGSPLIVKPQKWTKLQENGEVADGVAVMEGGKILVVAPTEAPTTLNWSSANVVGGGTTTTNRETAYNDWNGKANTASQIGYAEMSGTGYAPGFCYNYSRVNANGHGLTAGKWWLPSLGEMMMIYANMTKINYALSLIEGATQLQETAYWTSTEYSATHAWPLYLSSGSVSNGTKATIMHRVRPVSAFVS